MGRRDEARASIERALEIEPNNVEAIVNRATLSYEQGLIDEAIADYDRALKLKPDFAAAKNGRALADQTRQKSRL
jgi:tetratricopeptide (TPR) repeat protein